jgi:hypothetical protein
VQKRAIRVITIGAVAALMASAAIASSASAAPVWRAAGVPLEGSETVTAETTASTLTVPGLATTCAATVTMTVSNSGSKGVATVESMTLSGCGTNGVCTVESANALNLPWSGSTSVVSENNYLKIEGFTNKIVYGNPLCAAPTITYKGSVGGLFDNSKSRLVFSEASATATGASLKSIGSTKTGYDAEYQVKMTGSHAGQALTLS